MFGGAAAIVKGMGITFGEMLNPTITEDYPDAPANSRSAFAASTSCSAMRTAWRNASPVSCAPRRVRHSASILKRPRTPNELRISGGERYAKVYNIDYSRCIFCGYCVEACPTDAITHGHGFEIASYNTSTLIYRKEQMLVPIPQGANYPLQAEPAAPGEGH